MEIITTTEEVMIGPKLLAADTAATDDDHIYELPDQMPSINGYTTIRSTRMFAESRTNPTVTPVLRSTLSHNSMTVNLLRSYCEFSVNSQMHL